MQRRAYAVVDPAAEQLAGLTAREPAYDSADHAAGENSYRAAECADGCADFSSEYSASVTGCSAGSAHYARSCYLFALSHLRVVVGVRLVTVVGADDSVKDRAGAARELSPQYAMRRLS